ncbi:unnamed protein product [Ilex paraguariensis]|uniref:Morc S5 domain-containing protein n=1 Tax=Ilex paraguariensis TaxID=185542 RepID=A0ABC8QXU6_9AQUA
MSIKQESEENRSSSALSTGQSDISVLDQEQSPIDDTSLCSTSPICAAPVCRQFWKAGNYSDGLASKSTIQNGTSYLHIHPKFLHSNATSHKWAFGAIAELLDNAVDEIRNGATFVIVDKTSNRRNGSPALLIQDDGGGMDPDAMRRCLSFGFSDKKSKSTIGQYGNGFKTSSMRLGADVVVFSRHMKNRKLTQSIGLLSYTFLTQAGYDRIVVPMVDYEVNTSTGALDNLHSKEHYIANLSMLLQWSPYSTEAELLKQVDYEVNTSTGALDNLHSKEHYIANLSMLLQWSPYSTEAELLKQFEDVGYHGTKAVIYNLWINDEGTMELDFESDPEDILIAGEAKTAEKGHFRTTATEQHLANRLRYSLRAYLSVLYLRIPETFCILLRGRVVEYHNIANDLKFPEFILYRPQSGGSVEGTVVTTIGFLKEAPHVNIHGFNVYHKNRLILPFWHVVSYSDSRGRGVVGVLEANFIEPIHNKQDFEKTPVFQKLEVRLKEMTWEYWDYHCGLIGYHQVRKKPQAPTTSQVSSDFGSHHGTHQPVVLGRSFSAAGSTKATPAGAHLKRKKYDDLAELDKVKRMAGSNQEIQPAAITANHLEDQDATNMMQENKRLHALCREYEKRSEELNLRVSRLRSELGEAQLEHGRLLTELQLLEKVKGENDVNF